MPSKLETLLELQVLVKPIISSEADWQIWDEGPGIIHVDDGFDICVRIKNIGDAELTLLLKELSACEVLTCLDLSENRKITDSGAVRIPALSHLTRLNLSSCYIHDSTLKALADLKQLTWLNLSYCHRLTGSGFRSLRVLTNLKYVDIQGCLRINLADVRRMERRGLVIHR